MNYRTPMFTVLALAVAVATGCALPQNSPFEHLSEHRPYIEKRTNVLPPAAMLMHPGPGVDGPGPGVLIPPMAGPVPFIPPASQIAFTSPDGMSVAWDVSFPGAFDSEPLVVPGRYNFPEGAIYRLKLSNIAGRPGVELYPTLEVAPATPRTQAYIEHNSIPVQFTEDDLDHVLSGNFVTKVIYLPDPQYQELAQAGVETLVSTRLDPGVDPIIEATRRGSILAIIRLGNKDLEIPSGGNVAGGEIVPASYEQGGTPVSFHRPLPCGPSGCPMAMGPGGCAKCGPGGCGAAYQGPMGMPPSYVAGVTAPSYGMPITGTPIGLPGPPHIPLGVPAGLQQHVIANNTHMHIPGPTEAVRIDVKQEPGLSYPKPVDHVSIVEKAVVPPVSFHQPLYEKYQVVPGAQGAGCATGSCDYNAP